MQALCYTDDPVLKSYIEALLNSANIEYFVADESMQMLHPGLGVWSHRFFVAEDDMSAAIALLKDAEIDRAV